MSNRAKLRKHRLKTQKHARRSVSYRREPRGNADHPVTQLALWISPDRSGFAWHTPRDHRRVPVNPFRYEFAMQLATWMSEQDWFIRSVLHDQHDMPIVGEGGEATAWCDFFALLVQHFNHKLIDGSRFAQGVYVVAREAMYAHTGRNSRVVALRRLAGIIGCPSQSLADYLRFMVLGEGPGNDTTSSEAADAQFDDNNTTTAEPKQAA